MTYLAECNEGKKIEKNILKHVRFSRVLRGYINAKNPYILREHIDKDIVFAGVYIL